MKKRSVKIQGHATSITLEDEFWHALKNTAHDENLSINALISKIDNARTKNSEKNSEAPNLSSAIRLYILQSLQQKLSQ